MREELTSDALVRHVGDGYFNDQIDRGVEPEDLDVLFEANVLLALRSIDEKLTKLVELSDNRS